MSKQHLTGHPELNRGSKGKGLAAYELDFPNPGDDQLIGFIDTQYRAGKDRRISWEARASEQLAFVAGEQNMRWSRTARDLVERVLDADLPEKHRQKIQINTLKGFVLQRMSLLLGVPLTWRCIPWSSEDEDIATARISTKLLQHLWGGADPTFTSRLIDALWLMFCTGIVFVKTSWDPHAGPQSSYYPTDQDGDEEDQPGRMRAFRDRIASTLRRPAREVSLDEGGGYRAHSGDVKIEFISGFEITEPAFSTRMHDSPWLMQSTFITKMDLIDLYGDVARSIEPDSNSEAYRNGYARYYGNYKEYTDGDQTQTPAEMILTHELWFPRRKNIPKGFRCVVAGDQILKRGDHPFRHGKLPYTAMRELPDDRFRPACTIGMLIDLQDARNRNRSQVAQYASKQAEPRIIIEEGANLPEDAFTSGPKLIPVPTGMKDSIKAFEQPRLPPEVLRLDELYERDMQSVAGIHNSTLGRSESAQQSGRHAALLQESDRRGNTIVRMLVSGALEQVGGNCLWLYHQYAKTERLITVGGEHMEREVITFKGDDLMPTDKGRGGPYSFNVEVKIGAEPDMAAIIDKIEFLVKSGVLRPGESGDDRMLLQEMLGETLIRDDEGSRQRSRACTENQQMLEGGVARLARGDDDETHIREHERFTTTGRFRRELGNDPLLGVRFEQHIREHLFQIKERQLRPMYIEAAVRKSLEEQYEDVLGPPAGAAGPPGPPSRPMAGGPPPGGPPGPQGPGPMPMPNPQMQPGASPGGPPPGAVPIARSA